MVGGAKRARSRSLVLHDDENMKTPKRDKEPPMPRSLQYRKTLQRRKGNGVVKRLFKNSNELSGSSLNGTLRTLQRRSNKSIKSAVDLTITSSRSTRSSSRRRHRSGPIQETLEASPYRRNKKNVLPIPEDKQTSSRFSKHVQDFSSIFNRALSNVTKSILRYNSKS